MNLRPLILASACMLVASCQTIVPGNPPANRTDAYSALGTEPFWSLKIKGDAMRFERAGFSGVTASPFEARPSFNGQRYLAKNMTVDVTFAPCSDGMSDNTYKDTVTVMIGNTQYKGCGGGVLPPASLDGTGWTIGTIGGVSASDSVKTEVRFADGKISGTAGCNRFSGPYTVEANVLNVGPIAATKMMCPEPQMAQESRFLSLLGSGKLTKQFSVSGDLMLTNELGQYVRLRRNI
jgi:heat shock protein HslJ